MSFPASNDATVVMEPGKEAFDLPAPTFPSQGPPILRDGAAVREMRRDQFDAVCAGEVLIEAIAVVRPVADQPRREVGEESRVERGVDELGFMRRSAGHVDGERKTMAVANRHDFAPFTAFSRANGGAPFFAELKLASMKASLRSSLPRSRRSSASRCKTLSNRPLRCHC